MTRSPGPTPAASLRREPAPADAQRAHRQQAHRADPDRYGELPSDLARNAARAFATTDADEVLERGAGRGDDIRERSGFAVHFFPRELVGRPAEGWHLAGVRPVEEGAPPRHLPRLTQETPR
ncbi:hypothetical protein ACFV1W_27035 [Kitasatospora sp. NPDC059648]|uniref:hypothetical protein n=1 Tax=Kitasatospora sp. NPDC059648 TaxID=3346894 RepID=UPI003684DD54